MCFIEKPSSSLHPAASGYCSEGVDFSALVSLRMCVRHCTCVLLPTETTLFVSWPSGKDFFFLSLAIFSSAIFPFKGFQRESADLTEGRLFKQKTTSTTHQDWGFPCSFWEETGISHGLWHHLKSLLVTRSMRMVGVPIPFIAKRVDDIITYNRSSAFLWCCKLKILAEAESNWASSELIIFTILAISP